MTIGVEAGCLLYDAEPLLENDSNTRIRFVKHEPTDASTSQNDIMKNMKTRIEPSPLEKRVGRNILIQIGLHNEKTETLAKKIHRSATYVRNRREGKNAWSIADIEALANLWAIPVSAFFENTDNIPS